MMPNRPVTPRSWIPLAAGLALSALLAALVLLQSGPEGASAAHSGGNGKIVFKSLRDGNAELYVMEPDGSNQTRLTNTAMSESWPGWSPDGSKIAYDGFPSGNEQIYVMNADGSNQTRLTNNSARDAQGEWSPDGTKIAFGSNRTGAWQVYIMNADGSAQTQLTTTGNDNLTPAWSPDGSKIAFTSTRNGSYDVYVINIDGSNETRLTNGPMNESRADWSPYGSKIAYSSTDGVYVMNADGSGKVNLTSDGAFPSWSPDGTKIAFQSSRDGNSEIYVMNADGSQETRLVGTNTTEATPDWQPVCGGPDCSLPFPIPTPSTCPPPGCSTPPPAPTATPNGVDFSINAGTGSGASSACDSSGAPSAVCQVPVGALFGVSVKLNSLPAGMYQGKYQAFESLVQYTGVTQDGTDESLDFVWPGCARPASVFQPQLVYAGCVAGVGSSGSTYTGKLLTIEFRCPSDGSDGTITLYHSAGGTTALVDGQLMSFGEPGGTESLTIDCNDSSVPTPTPGPASVDFSIGIDDAGGTHICDSSGTPTTVCDIPLGAPFGVDVMLHSLPANISGYLGYDAYLLYNGLTLDQGNLEPERWPDCYFDVYYADADHLQVGCAIGIGASASTYTGLMTRVHFACDQPGTITLQHGPAFTDVVDENIQMWPESGAEGLTINCVQPLAYPADSDGDGCPDANESTLNPATGGRRNFYNEWDYLNPTHDGENRIDDVLAVVDQYFVDQGNPAYTQDTDRTLMGPHGWNLGPPDGKQRVDDILNSVHQYYQDCS